MDEQRYTNWIRDGSPKGIINWNDRDICVTIVTDIVKDMPVKQLHKFISAYELGEFN